MTQQRGGNAPRRGRGGGRPDGRPQPPGGGQGQRPAQPRRPGQRPQAAGGGGQRPYAPRPGGYQRRPSGPVQTGWTTVRPWRPPRDDADEPILDDDEKQPDWDANPTRTDAQRGSRSLTDGLGGQPRRGSRVRPPAWPGGGQRQGPRPQARRPDGGNQSGAGQNRPRPGGNSAGGGPPAGGGQRRRGTWMRPGAPRPDDE